MVAAEVRRIPGKHTVRVSYDAWSRWSLGAGYRALAVNYDRNNFLFDTRLKGMDVVVSYRTW